jgi:hypothetical protein
VSPGPIQYGGDAGGGVGGVYMGSRACSMKLGRVDGMLYVMVGRE